jgi:membrane protease YdiL (CAAX protease family)
MQGRKAADMQDALGAPENVWKERFAEVSVFLFLIVPSMVLSFFVTNQGSVDFVIVAVYTIFRDLALVSLVLLFTWRNGEPSTVLGWRFQHSTRNVAEGLVLYLPMLVVISLVDSTLMKMGLSEPRSAPSSLFQFRGQAEVALAVILVAVVAVSEETIFRGYLFLRLRTVTGSTTAALLLSAGVFALGHGYEGSLGVVTVGIMGLIFNLVYLWTGSLIAPMVMHFIQDFAGIVLVHYLK